MIRSDAVAGLGAAVLLATVFLPAQAAGQSSLPPPTFEYVTDDQAFPDAVEPGALRWTCAPNAEQLRRTFEARRTPFDPALASRRGRGVCHIDYTPTIAGFRAHPDDLPARDLFINVDSLALVARRTTAFGDALDISARIVEELERPVSIVLSMERRLSTQWYTLGAAQQYGNRTALVTWRTGSTPNLLNPWTQDFLKSGVALRRTQVLVPRNLFEGRADDGALFAPFLDSFQRDDGFVRSRLSWEGGDIQFVRHPRDRSKLVLVHGQSAKQYWGQALTDAEYAWVLRREFGADLSIDVSGIVPHVDYFVAFVPADGIVLVSEPVTGNRELAIAASRLLAGHFGDAVPSSVRDLARALDDTGPLDAQRRTISRLVDAARREAEGGWPTAVVADLYERVQAYVDNHCRHDPAACFNDAGVDRLLQDDPELFRDWITESRRTRSDELFTRRLLDIVESQVVAPSPDLLARSKEKVAELEALGFRIVRVPRFGSDQNGSTQWAGVSYVNSLLLDDVLFVPTFGLGAVEERMLEALQAALPPRYRVVPTYARHMLLHNGGVHCTVAIIRQPRNVDTLWMMAAEEDDE
jgi:hypothetical protein